MGEDGSRTINSSASVVKRYSSWQIEKPMQSCAMRMNVSVETPMGYLHRLSWS